jgi:GT2 family glycosyltransferase
MEMDISIIIISFNTRKYTKECIELVLRNTRGVNFEIIVVDNASEDGSCEYLSKLAARNRKIELVKNSENVGFAKANNLGTQKAKGKYVLFLNSDTLIKNNLLLEMIGWMEENPKVGIATCALKNTDGSLQGTGGYFPTLLRVFSWMVIQDLPLVDRLIRPFHPMKDKMSRAGEDFYKKGQEVDWVTGAFMLVRRGVFDGGIKWDGEYFMYTEDTDFCFQVKKAGWKVYYLPKWSITHIGGASSTKEYSVLKEFDGVKLFYKKHYPRWQYPILRGLLKIGALGRMVLFGILEGKRSALTYAKAFKQA